MVLQTVACGREARAFGRADIAGKLPKRHGFGGGETVANLSRSEGGRQVIIVLVNRRFIQGVPTYRFEGPAAFFEGGFASFDSLLELQIGIEPEYGQPRQPDTLLLAARRIDDRLAVAVDLVEPEAGRILDAAAGRRAEQFGLHPLGEFAQVRRHRIVGNGGHDAENDRTCQRRRDELPGGYAGRPCDHQFEPPRQCEIAGHRADQDAERHQLFEQLRHPVQRRLGHGNRGYRYQPGGLADHFDVVDQHEQHENARKHAHRRDQEAAGKVSPERVGHHAHAVAGRPNSRASRAFERLMASISAAGGSTTTPAMIIHSPMPIEPNSIKYWTRAMSGVFTVMTEQANPAMRRPNTARIDPPIEKLRLWRVVRGVPRNAKVRTENANG